MTVIRSALNGLSPWVRFVVALGLGLGLGAVYGHFVRQDAAEGALRVAAVIVLITVLNWVFRTHGGARRSPGDDEDPR